jgi:hypothetical protein
MHVEIFHECHPLRINKQRQMTGGWALGYMGGAVLGWHQRGGDWRIPASCPAVHFGIPAASPIAASADAWEDADEVLRVESALRESIAGVGPPRSDQSLTHTHIWFTTMGAFYGSHCCIELFFYPHPPPALLYWVSSVTPTSPPLPDYPLRKSNRVVTWAMQWLKPFLYTPFLCTSIPLHYRAKWWWAHWRALHVGHFKCAGRNKFWSQSPKTTKQQQNKNEVSDTWLCRPELGDCSGPLSLKERRGQFVAAWQRQPPLTQFKISPPPSSPNSGLASPKHKNS